MGQHVIRRDRLGLPQSARDVFDLLERAGLIDAQIATAMKKMVGFRNIAVHDYQRLPLPIVESVISHHMDEFIRYSEEMVKARD
jgi:uncharacterized protein YutE (UPF0331/DUF86 family)